VNLCVRKDNGLTIKGFELERNQPVRFKKGNRCNRSDDDITFCDYKYAVWKPDQQDRSSIHIPVGAFIAR